MALSDQKNINLTVVIFYAPQLQLLNFSLYF